MRGVVEEKYIQLIMDMYEGSSSTRVQCAMETTEEFGVTVGLHQGSALSPFLFAIVMDCLTGHIQRKAPWDVLCGETRKEVEERLEMWRGAMEDKGMRISREKTEYLGMCVADEETVKMQEEDVKSIENFKYLGSTVQKDGGVEKEVAKRVQAGWRAWRKITGVICDGRAPVKVKGKLYKTMVQSAMMYAIETVAVTKRQEEKMEVAEMKMLRYSLGKTKLDRVKNEDIGKGRYWLESSVTN